MTIELLVNPAPGNPVSAGIIGNALIISATQFNGIGLIMVSRFI